jgi:hypothetical protein
MLKERVTHGIFFLAKTVRKSIFEKSKISFVPYPFVDFKVLNVIKK